MSQKKARAIEYFNILYPSDRHPHPACGHILPDAFRGKAGRRQKKRNCKTCAAGGPSLSALDFYQLHLTLTPAIVKGIFSRSHP